MSRGVLDRRPSRTARFLIASLALLALLAWGASRSSATPTPPSDTISLGNPTVTWSGGNIVGANADESTCQEDLTCETFVLTLAPGDYTGKQIAVRINWLLPANDYDFYVHEGSPDGPIVAQGGAGATNAEADSIAIDPPLVAAPITYHVHVVAFAVAPGDNYSGNATFVSDTPARSAIYVAGTLPFSQNVPLKCPTGLSDGEPSVRCDVRGNCYVGGIRGVPAGVDLWRFDLDPHSPTFDPGMQNPTYLGQPDAFFDHDSSDTTAGGTDGGGDIDISCSFPTDPDSTPVLTITSLALANISCAVSFDRGETFALSPAVAIAPADDRQWNESTGDARVYMMYRAPIPATGLFCARSDDHGATYPIQTLVSPSGSTPGYLDVDHSNGTVYVAHQSSGAMFVARSTDQGLTWTNSTVDNATLHGELFDVVKVGDDGTVYACWSSGTDIYLAHSNNGGATWSDRVRVNDDSEYKINLLPWIEAGSAGRVAIVWYATKSATNDDDSDWEVLFAQSTDATAASPTFRQQVVSDHVIHGSNVSTGGLDPTGGSGNRNLIDYFQVAIDPQGAAVIAYTDDHNDYFGNLYVTRQISGTSLYASASNGSGLVWPFIPPQLPQPDPTAPEVIDFVNDAVSGLVQPLPGSSPFDIITVDYSCDDDTLIAATMKVSDLSLIPPNGAWRMSFTANAPDGVSDNGDQFFLRATTNAAGAPTCSCGTAVRDFDGGLTYTTRAVADFCQLNTADSTIIVKASINKLNPFVTHGPPISFGGFLVGLRGTASTQGSSAGISDNTYGGTRLACQATAVPGDASAGRPLPTALGAPVPNPTSRTSSVRFAIGQPGFVELSVIDVIGRRVRTIQAGQLARGEYTRAWDGRTDRYSNAAAGVYFFVLNTADGVRTQKVTMIR